MFETIKLVFGAIFVLLYVFIGDRANYYIKYHLLGVRAEVYGDTGDYIVSRFIWAMLLGWASIPIATIHYLVTNKKRQ